MSSAQVPVAGEGAAAAGGGALLSDAQLEEVARAVRARVLEDVGRLLEERVREGVERQTSALRQDVRALEEKVAALETRVQSCGDSLKQLEQRLAQAERGAGREGAVELSGRMESLEAALERALTTVMPKVEALVAQLEAAPRSTSSSHPPAAAASTSFAPPLAASTSSASPPSPARAPSPATRERLGGELLAEAEAGNAERVRELLDAGADVDARNSAADTALNRAACWGHAHVVSLLLGRGADARAKSVGGWTALHSAARHDFSGRCVSLLLDAGADADCVDDYRWTPLHLAAVKSNEEAVRALLAAGADRAARDRRGKTPLDRAVSDAVHRLLRG